MSKTNAFLINQIQYIIFDSKQKQFVSEPFSSLYACMKDLVNFEIETGDETRFEVVLGRTINGNFRILQTLSGLVEDATYRFFKSAHII